MRHGKKIPPFIKNDDDFYDSSNAKEKICLRLLKCPRRTPSPGCRGGVRSPPMNHPPQEGRCRHSWTCGPSRRPSLAFPRWPTPRSEVRRGRVPCAHRPERRRQVDPDQGADRLLPQGRAARCFRRHALRGRLAARGAVERDQHDLPGNQSRPADGPSPRTSASDGKGGASASSTGTPCMRRPSAC